jgi:dTDP-glucose pyrophosphorylase
MVDVKKHTILITHLISDALKQLNDLGEDLTLFVIEHNDVLIGTITDGDIRRGLLRNVSLQDSVDKVMQTTFKFIRKDVENSEQIQIIKERGVKILPVIDGEGKIVKLLNLSVLQAILPVDVVVMAGGEGRRLRPLTEKTPKPLLKVGDKPILEHTIDRLINFGAEKFHICIGYLGEQIQDYFNNGSDKGIAISYTNEKTPLGTIGAVRNISDFFHEDILLTNSDLLTNMDYQKFYSEFISQNADLAVATIPYNINVPYAVLETSDGCVVSLKEKPTYTYHANAGIYLIKKRVLDIIPAGFFNATDLMELLIQSGKKVVSYPIIGYWLDIGKHEDYIKAQEDIKNINFI